MNTFCEWGLNILKADYLGVLRMLDPQEFSSTMKEYKTSKSDFLHLKDDEILTDTSKHS